MEYDDDQFDEADFYGTVDTAPLTAPDVDDVDEGQAEEVPNGDEGAAPEVAEAPQVKYFDPTTVADHVVKVKVNGEEIEVPVSDLTAGYSRTADYTQKTQALAAEREQIAFWQQVDQAMRVNPQMTLQYLQQTYGITPAQASAAVEQATGADDAWGDDPAQLALKQELQELRAMVQPVVRYTQVQQAEVDLRQTVQGLTQKYGADFNPTEVVQEAIRRGATQASQLESVFRDMQFDKYRALASANQTLQGQAAATDAQRIAAAQQAAAITGAGRSASGVAASPPSNKSSSGRMTVAQAFAAAKAEHGYS